ncbi:MAG TPA: hypothetical protein VHY77_11550, partial [Acidimicrobiales bacterium]|nr:hypothetical protein [Acidimicrobiales bacterium]
GNHGGKSLGAGYELPLVPMVDLTGIFEAELVDELLGKRVQGCHWALSAHGNEDRADFDGDVFRLGSQTCCLRCCFAGFIIDLLAL